MQAKNGTWYRPCYQSWTSRKACTAWAREKWLELLTNGYGSLRPISDWLTHRRVALALLWTTTLHGDFSLGSLISSIINWSTSVTPPSSLQHQTAFPFSILDLLCIRDLWGSSYLFKTQLFFIFNVFLNNWYVHWISEFTNVKETQLIKISNGFCFLKWLPT